MVDAVSLGDTHPASISSSPHLQWFEGMTSALYHSARHQSPSHVAVVQYNRISSFVFVRKGHQATPSGRNREQFDQ
jgi:hypothetical protein